MDHNRAALKEAVLQLISLHGGQSALARTLGVDQTTVSRFLRGDGVTPKMAQRIVAAFPGLKPQVDDAFFAPDTRVRGRQ